LYADSETPQGRLSSSPYSIWRLTTSRLLDQRTKIDRLESCPGELGVGPGGLADVVDQPVEPDNILARHGDEFLLELRVVDPIQSIQCRTERRERVLKLVGDVGGERLGIVDPLPQRLAHVGDGAREQADLIGSRGQPRNVDFTCPAKTHPMCGKCEAAKRPDDRPGEENR